MLVSFAYHSQNRILIGTKSLSPLDESSFSVTEMNLTFFSGKVNSKYIPIMMCSRPKRLRSLTMMQLILPASMSFIIRLNAGLSKFVPE